MILIVYPTASICCKKKREGKTNFLLFIWWLWCLATTFWPFCQLSEAVAQRGSRHTHTHPVGSGANLRGSLHWPRPDKVPVDETSFISSCCCSLGVEAATNQLKDSGAKRWKPRSTEPQAWSKGMRPGLGEAAELIGPAVRLWWRRSLATDSFRCNQVFPMTEVKSASFLILSLTVILS